MDRTSDREALAMLALVAVLVLEVLRRVFGTPYGDVRRWLIMAGAAVAIAAALLLALAFLFHLWPFD